MTSPGGFVGDVSPENVLRHAPVRRNHLLADAFQAIGLVNRSYISRDPQNWQGIPALRIGRRHREADASNQNGGFARFVAERYLDGEELELDDLMVMRSLMTRDELNRWSALLKIAEADAADRLAPI